MAAVGVQLLLATFAAHAAARASILDLCQAALAAAPRADGAALHLRLLALLCRRHGGEVAPHVPRLKESLEYAALLR